MIKPGDIALFRHVKRGMLGDIIEEATKSPYTHAAVFITEDIFIEAYFPHVRLRALVQVDSRDQTIDVYSPKTPLTPQQLITGIGFLKGELGLKYNFWSLVGLLLFNLHIFKENIFYSRHHHVICSQLAYETYVAMGHSMELDKYLVTPATLATWDILQLTEKDVAHP